ncbi:MAG: sigma-54 dependent transcriptional regulator [Bacteroidota bacterium]
MDNIFKVFLVEDDRIYAKMLQSHLSSNPDCYIEVFENGADFLNNLYRSPDFISLDYSLPDFTGADLLEKIKDFNPEIPVVMVSGQDEVLIAIDLFKAGIIDYIVKNNETKERLWNAINRAKENQELRTEISSLRSQIASKFTFNDIIGNSPGMQQVLALIDKACRSNIMVSLHGEVGIGKETIAKTIHYNSIRSGNAFISVNAATIAANKFDLEFFGYEKDAFPGAYTRKAGYFEEASNGTIYISEIQDLDSNMQAKLLRVIQEKQFTRIGGTKTIKTDVRIITSTSKNLVHLIQKNEFRKDLYYSLLGMPIEIPSLKSRGNDILALAKYFLEQFCADNNMVPPRFAHDTQVKLLNYNYPGNVRELKTIIELAVTMSAGSREINHYDIIFNPHDKDTNFITEELTLYEYDMKIVKHFLKKYDNDIQMVADKLDIGKSTIYRYLKKGDIQM